MSSGVTAISRYSEATIPTTHGKLTVVVYREVGERPAEHEHMAIVAGPLDQLVGGDAAARPRAFGVLDGRDAGLAQV